MVSDMCQIKYLTLHETMELCEPIWRIIFKPGMLASFLNFFCPIGVCVFITTHKWSHLPYVTVVTDTLLIDVVAIVTKCECR